MAESTSNPGLVASSLQVSLPTFEGPLDLLLYLIRKNRLNIYDIPIARITEEYLRSLEQMRSLNLEAAGHFLEMAATLAYIKSHMLIPRVEDEQEFSDLVYEIWVKNPDESQRRKAFEK